MTELRTRYLIRLSAPAHERADAAEITRMIEYLGGVSTPVGFAFYSQKLRAEALQILTRQFEERFFEVINDSSDDH